MGLELSYRGDGLQCASCCQAGQQAASSMRGLRDWGASSLWENSDCQCESNLNWPSPNHTALSLQHSQTRLCLLFHCATVCKWKHAFLLSLRPHQVIGRNFFWRKKRNGKKGSVDSIIGPGYVICSRKAWWSSLYQLHIFFTDFIWMIHINTS